MIVPIDQNLRAVVKFRHRYFIKMHVPCRHMHETTNWVELSGGADDCHIVASGLDCMYARIHLLHGLKPLYLTRGTVCTLKFLECNAGKDLGWVTVRGAGTSAFVVCAWDSTKDRHEPFVKRLGRRESLRKAISGLGDSMRGKTVKAGLLDMVCPEPPPKKKIRRDPEEGHVEVSGDMRIGL